MSRRKKYDPHHAPSPVVRALAWVEDPEKVKRFFWALVGIGAVLTVLDLFYKKKTYFDIEHLFGFYSIYGFFMCAALVVAAKGIRFLLMRKETYYAPNDVESEEHPSFDLDRRQADEW